MARTSWIAGMCLVIAGGAAAQTPQPPLDDSVTDTLEGRALQELPVADDLFGVLETMHAAVISDRFSPGGLSAAQPIRVGAYMNSWTQTAFRIGDVDITSADGGIPLLVPPLLFWERIGVTTGGTPADSITPGLRHRNVGRAQERVPDAGGVRLSAREAHDLAGLLELAGSRLALPGFIADHAPINYAIRIWNCLEAS